MKHCYFLLYRVPSVQTKPINWDKPDGGLVMKPKHVCSGVSVPDVELAQEVASHRYHCAPHETLLLVEVFEEYDKSRARRLHKLYERNFHEFLELMNVG